MLGQVVLVRHPICGKPWYPLRDLSLGQPPGRTLGTSVEDPKGTCLTRRCSANESGDCVAVNLWLIVSLGWFVAVPVAVVTALELRNRLAALRQTPLLPRGSAVRPSVSDFGTEGVERAHSGRSHSRSLRASHTQGHAVRRHAAS